MRDLGWIEGRNVQIEYRFAGTNPELINKQVAELIRLAPDVIVANTTLILAGPIWPLWLNRCSLSGGRFASSSASCTAAYSPSCGTMRCAGA